MDVSRSFSTVPAWDVRQQGCTTLLPNYGILVLYYSTRQTTGAALQELDTTLVGPLVICLYNRGHTRLTSQGPAQQQRGVGDRIGGVQRRL